VRTNELIAARWEEIDLNWHRPGSRADERQARQPEGASGAPASKGCLLAVDLVMGSFSKPFGSNGGFVAIRESALKQFLKVYSPLNTFSNALRPSPLWYVLPLI